MEDKYNQSIDAASKRSGVMGIIGAIYGWSVLDMYGKFSKTGKFSAPYTEVFNGGTDIGIDVVGSLIEKRASSFDPLGTFMYGGKYRPFGTRATTLEMGTNGARSGLEFGGRMGAAALMGSRVVRSGLFGLEMASPAYFAVAHFSNPLMWGVGATWFGGRAFLGNISRAMRNTMYENMGRSGFEDSMGTYTSRQRAVRAIAESNLQARAAIGNEAQLFHH